MILYRLWIASAFGDPPDFGVRKLARRPRGQDQRADRQPGSGQRPAGGCGGGGTLRQSRRVARLRHSIQPGLPPSPVRSLALHCAGCRRTYTARSLSVTRAIRAAAWMLVAAGRRGAHHEAASEVATCRRARYGRFGARRAVCGHTTQSRTRRGPLCAEYVGIPGRLRDAERRSRAPRGARAGRLPDQDRSRARSRACRRRSGCSGRSRLRAR